MSLRLLPVFACLSLLACAETAYPPGSDPAFGEAVRANMAAHIINPVAPDPRLDIPADGQRRALMIERYRLDEVETPATTAISDVGPTGAPDE